MWSATVYTEGVGIHLGRGAFLFKGGGWYSYMHPLGIFQSRGVFSAPTPPLIFNIYYIIFYYSLKSIYTLQTP